MREERLVDIQKKCQISRVGVYGVAVLKHKILLTVKEKGPYEGLFDLPGGKIEFGETPTHALLREFEEEVAMSFEDCLLWQNFSHFGIYSLEAREIEFHHLGMIYRVFCLYEHSERAPEEVFEWHALASLDLKKLTPFAKQAVCLIVSERP